MVAPLHLPRARLEQLLDHLEEGADDAAAWTAYVPPGEGLEEVLGHGRHALPPPALDKAARRLAASETGGVVLWGPGGGHVVLPPFPVRLRQVVSGVHTGPLRELLAQEYRVGVVLLRLGGYAVGVFHGARLVLSKTGTRYVKGGHRAGGSSARRFERIRENQAQALFDEVCQVVQTRFSPMEAELDFVLLGGERHTLQRFMKRCPYLQRLAPMMLRRVLDVPEPRRSILEAAPAVIWSSRVYVLPAEG